MKTKQIGIQFQSDASPTSNKMLKIYEKVVMTWIQGMMGTHDQETVTFFKVKTFIILVGFAISVIVVIIIIILFLLL